MTDEITYPISKDDYCIDYDNTNIIITLKDSYTVTNLENKKIINTPTNIKKETDKGKPKTISIIGLNTITLPVTTINMSSENCITLGFKDPSDATVNIKLPVNSEQVIVDVAKQINPIYCRDIVSLVDFVQVLLFTVYNDSDVLSLIDNTVPEVVTETEDTNGGEGNTTTETTTETNNDNTGDNAETTTTTTETETQNNDPPADPPADEGEQTTPQ